MAAAALAAAVVMLGLPPTGYAQEWRGYHGWHPNAWHGGRWVHGWHGGRYGWWWLVPGLGWTFYSAPVYPYPPMPVPAALPGPPPPAATWYYCANPRGYYPYIGRCYVPWQPVPAQ